MSETTRRPAPEPGTIPPAEAVAVGALVACADGAIVSRTLVKKPAGTVTLFAFDAGQALSEHTAPFDALVQVLDGEVELAIGGKPVRAHAGELVLMPADVPHALRAVTRMKMLLVMIK
jgi:quercetin dioxygenase-like cupin family protein